MGQGTSSPSPPLRRVLGHHQLCLESVMLSPRLYLKLTCRRVADP